MKIFDEINLITVNKMFRTIIGAQVTNVDGCYFIFLLSSTSEVQELSAPLLVR